MQQYKNGPGENQLMQKRGLSIGQIFNKLGLVLIIIVFAVVLAILSPSFLTLSNMLNLMVQSTILLTMSVGATFVILTGGIDLSVGSVLAFSSTVGMASIAWYGMPVPVGVLITLGIGALFGIVNGVFVTKGGVPPMIVTLGTMSIGRGAQLVYSNGSTVSPIDDSLTALTYNGLFGIPWLVWLVVAIAIVGGIVLSKTTFGRSVYAVGGNELATKLAGIKTHNVKMWCYVICGLTAALAGLFLAIRIESVSPQAGNGNEMNVIAAVVIGGCSLFGGRGNMFGTVMGVLLITLVTNAVNLLGVPPAWDQIVKGLVILAASLLDVYRIKFAGGRKKRKVHAKA